jgi:tetrahydromethanopterin S-methyltransferase subunit G
MPEENGPDNIVLRYLRRIDERLDTIDRKVDEVILRLGRLEEQVAGLHVDNAILHQRIDNLDRRVSRIEKRLDLAEAPSGNV